MQSIKEYSSNILIQSERWWVA